MKLALTLILLSSMALAAANLDEVVRNQKEKHKMMLVFAQDKNDPEFIKQMSALSKADRSIKKQDLKVITALRGEEGTQSLFDRYEVRDKRFLAVVMERGGDVRVRSERALTGEEIVRAKNMDETRDILNQPTMDPVMPEPDAGSMR